jgi:hypothetical protein
LDYILNSENISVVIRSKNLSIGVWRPTDAYVKLTKTKGKFVHYMGFNSTDNQGKSADFLTLEEALFLLESVRL